MRKFSKTLVVICALTLIVSVLSCSQPAATPSPTVAPKPTATTAAPTTTAPSASPQPTTAAPTATAAPAAGSAADFYKNNTVTLIVPRAAGGGVDYAGRIVASFWGTLTGGNMIVKNVEGASGITGTNQVFKSKPDGLTIGVEFLGSQVANELTKDPAVQFKLKEFNWIGQIAATPQVLITSAKSSYDTIEKLKASDGFKFAGPNPFGSPSISAAFTIYALGMKNPKIVLGYGGSAEGTLALGRGEVDGYVTNDTVAVDSIAKKWAQPKILISYTLKRSAEFPDVPSMMEIAKLTPEQEAMATILAGFMTGRAYFMTPGVPQDRVTYMRGIFDQMVKQKGFVDIAKREWPFWTEPQNGEALTKEVTALFAVPPAVLDKFNELIKQYAK